MKKSYYHSKRLMDNGLWELVFDQQHDAFTTRITATLSEDSMSRLTIALGGFSHCSGEDNRFLKAQTRNLLLAGYMPNTSSLSDLFPDIKVVVPLSCSISKIIPYGDGCTIFASSMYSNGCQFIELKDVSFQKMLTLFNKSSFEELVDYLRDTNIFAEVWNENCLYIPIPIPAVNIEAKVL